MTERRARRSRRSADRLRDIFNGVQVAALVVVLVWMATAFAARQDEFARGQTRLTIQVDHLAVLHLEALDQLCDQALVVSRLAPTQLRPVWRRCERLRDRVQTSLTATQAAEYEHRNKGEHP